MKIGPDVLERSPPRITAPASQAASLHPDCSAFTTSSSLTAIDTKTPTGTAPIAATSDSAHETARNPISLSSSQALLKWTSSNDRSVLRTHPPSMTAASSPEPKRTPTGSTSLGLINRRIRSNSAPGPRRTGPMEGDLVTSQHPRRKPQRRDQFRRLLHHALQAHSACSGSHRWV